MGGGRSDPGGSHSDPDGSHGRQSRRSCWCVHNCQHKDRSGIQWERHFSVASGQIVIIVISNTVHYLDRFPHCHFFCPYILRIDICVEPHFESHSFVEPHSIVLQGISQHSLVSTVLGLHPRILYFRVTFVVHCVPHFTIMSCICFVTRFILMPSYFLCASRSFSYSFFSWGFL